MRKLILLAVLLGVLAAGSASASPTCCYCYGGMDGMGGYWYLLDPYGYPLQDGDYVYAAWAGPDEWINPPASASTGDIGAPTGDDVLLAEHYIEWSNLFILVIVYDTVHPMQGDLIYCRMFDGPKDQLSPDNFFNNSQLYELQHVEGEAFFCTFQGWGLPFVELMSFTALGRDGQVLLEWKTATEVDNLGFYMERSLDAVTFQRITEDILAGAGDSETENTYAYVDRGLTNGTTYYYNLISVDMDGVEEVANENPVAATPMAHVPAEFDLCQNRPNPFNAATDIRYALSRDVRVTLKVYNVLGAEVATLVNIAQQAGVYTVRWDAGDLASGVYFCTLSAGDFTATRKMVLLK